jgi:phage host-nuclease inhibitor protein Gam
MMEATLAALDAAPDTLPATVQELHTWMATASAAAVDAQAGWWLRSLALATRDSCALEERRDAERALVDAHYARALAPLADQIAGLERTLRALADRITLPKGRKSVALTWGLVGRKSVPARASVVDAVTALTFARAAGALRITEAVDVKKAAPLVLALVAESGEVPDGWEFHAAHEAPVVTLNSRAAAGVDA